MDGIQTTSPTSLVSFITTTFRGRTHYSSLQIAVTLCGQNSWFIRLGECDCSLEVRVLIWKGRCGTVPRTVCTFILDRHNLHPRPQTKQNQTTQHKTKQNKTVIYLDSRAQSWKLSLEKKCTNYWSTESCPFLYFSLTQWTLNYFLPNFNRMNGVPHSQFRTVRALFLWLGHPPKRWMIWVWIHPSRWKTWTLPSLAP